ncbi:MAG: PilN domain-containing protein [Gemmatimonadota bacterium]
MIEINLLPGTEKKKRKKRKAGAALPFELPSSLPDFDRMMAFIVAAWIIGPLVGLWLFFGVRGDMADTRVSLDEAAADSARYARIIETQTGLRARQDTIAQKLQMIQEIDAGRYVWPHILDEVSRALPPFTWLESIDQVGSGGTSPEFQIVGRTGSLPALTRFMDALEASPFLRNIQLIDSEQAQLGGDPTKIVNNFALSGSYEVPPLDVVETVPLFESEGPDTTAAVEASNGSGTP